MVAQTSEGRFVVCVSHGRHAIVYRYNGEVRIRHANEDFCDSQRFAVKTVKQVERDEMIELLLEGSSDEASTAD